MGRDGLADEDTDYQVTPCESDAGDPHAEN